MAEPTTAETITSTWRSEAALLVAALTRMTRDVGLAEDLAQDALVAALEQWPQGGIPTNPGAWLMTTAKRRAVDHFRRADTLRRKTEELGRGLSEEDGMPDLSAQVDFIEDDVLRLIFLSCHPRLTPESRAARSTRRAGTTPAISASSTVGSSTSPAAGRISSSSGGATSTPRTWRRSATPAPAPSSAALSPSASRTSARARSGW